MLKIEFDPLRYQVRDGAYEKEISSIIDRIREFCKSDSFSGVLLAISEFEKLSMLYLRNLQDYNKHYKTNVEKLLNIKNKVHWDFIEPLTMFEAKIKPVLYEAENLLSEINYKENSKSEILLERISNMISDFSVESRLIDAEARNTIFNMLNRIRNRISSDSYMSYVTTADMTGAIEKAIELNSTQFEKIYLKCKNRYFKAVSDFENIKKNVRYSDAKKIQNHIEELNGVLESQSYNKFSMGLEKLIVLEKEINEYLKCRQETIVDKLRKEMSLLKESVWVEDWDEMNSELEKIIDESTKKCSSSKLNLDNFRIDQKKKEKKDEIRNLIKSIESSKNSYNPNIVGKLESLNNSTVSKSEFEKFKAGIGNLNSRSSFVTLPVKSSRQGKKIYYSFLSILILASVSLFVINNKKNVEHFEAQGEKYAVIVETLAYLEFRSGKKPDINVIRRKIMAPQDQFQIISITDSEVSVRYRGKVYKKSVRPIKK
ncbi:MAG: hypothetical protein WC212_00755 [Candidatus Delongbacteria bacterium]